MKPAAGRRQEAADREILAGPVERVTFQNPENGFCVLRIRARGHRDLVPVVGHAASRCFVSLLNTTQWMAITGDHRRAAADRAADCAGLCPARPALVRLLWRGCVLRGRQRNPAGTKEHRPAGGDWPGAAAGQRDNCDPSCDPARGGTPSAGKHRRWSSGLAVWDMIVREDSTH